MLRTPKRMKISYLLTCIALPIAMTAMTGGLAQNPSTLSSPTLDKFHTLQDATCLPATTEQIQDDLRSSPNNPLALYNAVRQAGHDGLELDAYAELRKLLKSDPDDPNLLAAYCFSYGVASGDYPLNRFHRAFGDGLGSDRDTEYQQDLAKAERLDPNLWLIYIVKAQPAIYPGNGKRAESVAYLRKAVALAPDISYTHHALAYILLLPNVSTRAEREEGVREDQIAAKSRPVDSDAPWSLFEYYAFIMHDRAKALVEEKIFLSEIPPGFKLSSGALGLMANYSKRE